MKKDFDYKRRGDYDYGSDSQNEFDILIKSDRFECSHSTQNEIAIVISNSDLRHHLKHSRKGFKIIIHNLTAVCSFIIFFHPLIKTFLLI